MTFLKNLFANKETIITAHCANGYSVIRMVHTWAGKEVSIEVIERVRHW